MADTTTPNLGLTKPTVGVSDPAVDWATKLNTNFDLIDAIMTESLPSIQGFGDSASPGNTLQAARADHKHGMPSLANVYQNLLTNGSFDVWQRGDGPFSSPANNAYTADKWQTKKGGGTPPTFTIAKETSVVDASSSYALKLACSNIGASLTDGLYISQSIENYKEFRGKQIAVSVRVRTSLAAKVKIRIKDSAGNTASTAHTGSDTFETLTVVRTVDASATYLLIEVGMLATSDVTVATVYVDSAMLVLNASAVTYVPLPWGHEINRCLRYYQTLQAQVYSLGGSDGTNYKLGDSTQIVPMPATATITTSTLTSVSEEGSVTDLKANYSLTTTLTNYAASASYDFTTLTYTIAKAIAGNKPNSFACTVVMEV